MLGVGDCLHQRAPIRDLMQTHDVTLWTYYTQMYHDLVRQGLKLLYQPKGARIKEDEIDETGIIPRTVGKMVRLTYTGDTIKAHGSILAAQYKAVGLTKPVRPDFSLPVKPEWIDRARDAIIKAVGAMPDKPIMVVRPIVVNSFWSSGGRSPDAVAYNDIYKALREDFFTISMANFGDNNEEPLAPVPVCDLHFDHGELRFETMTGMFKLAAVTLTNPGLTPILSQAVGTPTVIMYGGFETYNMTNAVGKYLAPTLAIEPIHPCGCYDRNHKCNKTIDVPAAINNAGWFLDQYVLSPKTLIFGTAFADTDDKITLLEQWATLHGEKNKFADLMLVDSASPEMWHVDGSPTDANRLGRFPRLKVFSFDENIGHLARGGADGWGRALSYGLQYAINNNYEFVVHVEGDSLLRRPVLPTLREMQQHSIDFYSPVVIGTRFPEKNWVETGLMFFSVDYLKRSGFIEQYAWHDRTPDPVPERVIFDLVQRTAAKSVIGMDWCTVRDDNKVVTPATAGDFDWITHADPEVFNKFMETVMPPPNMREPLKVNFGCGTNKLPGWNNHDIEVDIRQRLPYDTGSVDFILAEHVMEHVTYLEAFKFLQECRRILAPKGVLRIAVPSIESVINHATEEYIEWAHGKGWAKTKDLRGAAIAQIECHGHAAAWTDSLLASTLWLAGFAVTQKRAVGKSPWQVLNNVEGHGKVIGDSFNSIETIVWEAWS